MQLLTRALATAAGKLNHNRRSPWYKYNPNFYTAVTTKPYQINA